MRVKRYFQEAISLPPKTLFKKIILVINRFISQKKNYLSDLINSSYSDVEVPNNLERYLSTNYPPSLIINTDNTKIAEYCLKHRFNLLGSGWVNVLHDMPCQGLEGHHYDIPLSVNINNDANWLNGIINSANLAESKRIRSHIGNNYTPIDWQLDFKSGYRWAESTWYHNIEFGHKSGVDIKIPWELARMQHLPQLALMFASSTENSKQLYYNEFLNQILDFISTNPPRFGVNWRCTMDVGIRVANWLVAYDIYIGGGGEFDQDFCRIFKRSIYEHGLHIINNLEGSSKLRSNHYLADIVGLLFTAAYLPCSPQTDSWLAFAVQELTNCVENQFHPDGSNFEASTSYHCLSAEMVIYATALVLGLPSGKKKALQTYDHELHKVKPVLQPAPLPLFSIPDSDIQTPFPTWYFQRLEKMAEFIIHTSRPDGLLPQIGDNDNGRFLKLSPYYRQLSMTDTKQLYINLENHPLTEGDDWYWDEVHQHRHYLVAAINGLFNRHDFSKFYDKNHLEETIICQLAGNIQLPTSRKKKENHNSNASFNSYPDFGLYCYSDDIIHLIIRCGQNGQNGNGGHAHNDQLSFELSICGTPVFIDPGTYLYTPIPQKRNMFRSTAWHNTVYISASEQNRWIEGQPGLFSLKNDARARCTNWDNNGDMIIFTGEHYYGNTEIKHVREFIFNKQNQQLQISDKLFNSPKSKQNIDGFFVLHTILDIQSAKDALQIGGLRIVKDCDQKWQINESIYSPHYGSLQPSKRAIIKFTSELCVTMHLSQ